MKNIILLTILIFVTGFGTIANACPPGGHGDAIIKDQSYRPGSIWSAMAFDGSLSHCPDGTIVQYLWTVSGSPSNYVITGATTSIATCKFRVAGNYSVTLKVWDNAGRTSQAMCTVSIASYSGSVKYVSPLGNDTWDGNTPFTPKKTLQAATTAASADCLIILANGTYSGSGNKNIYTYGKSLYYENASGAEYCCIDGENTNYYSFCDLYSGNPISFEKIKFKNQAATTLYYPYCDLSFYGCVFEHCQQAISVGGRLYVSACEFTDTIDSTISCNGDDVDVCVDNSNFSNSGARSIIVGGINVNCVVTNCSFIANKGAILCCKESACLISECTFEDCSKLGGGGGAVYCYTPENWEAIPVRIEDSIFTNCTAKFGGAIYGSANMYDCTISHCRATDGGGGFCGAFEEISGCSIQNCQSDPCDDSGNFGYCSGGGMLIEFRTHTSTLSNCVISDNNAFGRSGGGGIYIWPLNYGVSDPCQLFINNCTISRNRALMNVDNGGYGGAISEASFEHVAPLNDLIITNSVIANNTSEVEGGGVYFSGPNCFFNNCLIVGNVTEDSEFQRNRSALFVQIGNCYILNTTIADNIGGSIYLYSDCPGWFQTLEMYNTIVLGGIPSSYSDSLIIGTNNAIGGYLGLSSDYHLMVGSSCINAGTALLPSGFPLNLTEFDMDGQDRVNGIVDIGADEYYP